MTTRARMFVAVLVVVAALAGSAALIVNTAAAKTSIEHDEGITFIQAAGHMPGWVAVADQGVAPAGEWVPADTWQSFMRPSSGPAFGEVSRGLAQWDIHPPVYFWLLHGWSLAFGMSVMSALLLNITLAVITGLLLFGLGMWVLRDPLPSAAVVTFWSLSAPSVGTSVIARQYGLTATLAVALIWAGLALFSPPRRPGWLAVALVAALVGLGLGTHYQFAVVVAGFLAWCTAVWWRRWRRLGCVYLAALGGVLLFLSMGTGVRRALSIVDPPGSPEVADLAKRLRLTVETIVSFVAGPSIASESAGQLRTAMSGALALGILMAVVAAVLFLGLRRREGGADQSVNRLAAVSLIGLWVLVCVVGLFITGRSPGHAMGDRYLAMAWPLLAFLPIVLFRRLPASLAVGLVIALAALSVPSQLLANQTPSATPSMRELLAPAQHIVVDTLARGVLPRLIIDTPASAQVFAASQSRILADVEVWAQPLQPGDLVLSDSSYAEAPDNKALIRAELKKRFVIEKVEGPWPLTWWRIVSLK